ncbi:hypothetical protein DJ52_13755 [Brachyspira murdochii]|uniref:Uncharacterized protein n=1 Tax=Brachyspira murdochii TaxID=84378 RepID=A0ABX5B189_9SPIR|nr:hypothetical protein DJ52_13755 [Brachyspira murdochii]
MYAIGKHISLDVIIYLTLKHILYDLRLFIICQLYNFWQMRVKIDKFQNFWYIIVFISIRGDNNEKR